MPSYLKTLFITSIQIWSEFNDILSTSARTLKVLRLTVPIYDDSTSLRLAGLCEELEAMTGYNMLEALSLEVEVDDRPIRERST